MLLSVRNMICRVHLPKYIWGEAVKIANYLLNRVPSKVTVSCYFIGYAERSKGFRFYCSSNQGPKIVETEKAIFMEHSLDNESRTNDNDFMFEEERDTGTTIEHAKISSFKAPTVAIEFPSHMHDDTNEVERNVNSKQGNNVGATPPIANDVNINGVNEPMDTEALNMQTQQQQEGGTLKINQWS
ncbi:hypothetical protein D8674_003626 [Pyrus ussuriensis x Pyrus communis]|uniref:Retroviral polymerase SH3-like domain-containing protein n=1 Tax=Pyrus ussuriensis x Pyrus communis TaxID=2448454 RepID=A0A5N5FLT5_9ROSA|nr:hypothetical protein D8674_003626 [Pyrus ussuriensis x Pyrus communis]